MTPFHVSFGRWASGKFRFLDAKGIWYSKRG